MKKLLSLLVLVAFFGLTSCDATMDTTRSKTSTRSKTRPKKETNKPKSPPEKISPQNIKSAESKPEQTLKNP